MPQGRYSDVVEKLKPERGQAGRDRACRRPRARPPRRRHPLHGRPAARARHRRRRAALRRAPRCGERARHRRPARGARHALASRSATSTGSGERTLAGGGGGARRSSRASAPRVRRRRRCSACDGGAAGGAISPADETGVAPGQACVLYDGDGPDARVLGGGTIDTRVGGSERAEAAYARSDAVAGRRASEPSTAQVALRLEPALCGTLSGKALWTWRWVMANESTERRAGRTPAGCRARRRHRADAENLDAQVETLKADLAAISATLAELREGRRAAGPRQGRADGGALPARRARSRPTRPSTARAPMARRWRGRSPSNPFTAVLVALGLGYPRRADVRR